MLQSYFMRGKNYNIGIISHIEINDVVYRIKGLHHLPKVGKKPRGRPSDTKRTIGTMDMFMYEHFKRAKITEEIYLSTDFQATSGV